MSTKTEAYTFNIQPEITYEKSPLFKAVSCIPLVGIVSSCFAFVTIANKDGMAKKSKNIIRRINIITAFKELKKIDVFRNLLTIALIVGAVAFGILSAPVGITLASLLFLSAVYDVALIIVCNKRVQYWSSIA